MSNHGNSTPAPKSIGELSENIVSDLAKTRPTGKDFAEAIASLENEVRELMLMADIATNAWDNIGPPKRVDDNCFQYQCTRLERDCFDFLINNVAERANLLRERFEAAFYGL